MRYVLLLTVTIVLFRGSISAQSPANSIIKQAIYVSELGLYYAKFEEAANLVEQTQYQDLEGFSAEHRILLTVQDLRIIRFRNIVYNLQSDPQDNFTRLNDLLPEVDASLSLEARAGFFLAFSNAHRSIGNPDSAVFYEDKAMSIYKAITDNENIARIRASRISRLHVQLLAEDRKEEIIALIPEYEIEIEFSKIHSKYALSYNTRHLAQIHRRQTQDYQRALELFRWSLDLREEIGFRVFLPASWSSIGDVLLKMGEYDKAIEAYLKASALADEIGFVRYQSYTLMSIGDCYWAMNEKAMALEYYQASLDKAITNDYEQGLEQVEKKIHEIKK